LGPRFPRREKGRGNMDRDWEMGMDKGNEEGKGRREGKER